MIISFGKTGGSAKATADYMTAENDHKGIEREDVQVLRGSPRLVAKIADELSFKNTYSAGIIAFTVEEEPSEAELIEVLDKFESLAFAGLDENQYSWSAVLHEEENGSKHIHFLIAGVDLDSGKKFNPAPPGHRKAFDALRDSIIFDKGWADPNDKARSRLSNEGYLSHLADDKNPKKAIADYLTERVEMGLISNRSDVVKSLDDIGEVTRQGEHYISVKPDGFTKAIRLKGDLYEREFNSATYEQVAEKESAGQSRGGKIDLNRSQEATEKLQRFIESRTEFNQQRYPTNVEKSMESTAVSRFDDLPSHLSKHLGSDAILLKPGGEIEPRESKAGIDSQDFAERDRGAEFQHVRQPRPSMRSNRRERARVPARVSDNKKEVDNDRIRDKFNELARSAAERVRAAGEEIHEFFTDYSRSESGIDEAIKLNDESIKRFAEEQQRAEQSHQSVANNSEAIEQKQEKERYSGPELSM